MALLWPADPADLGPGRYRGHDQDHAPRGDGNAAGQTETPTGIHVLEGCQQPWLLQHEAGNGGRTSSEGTWREEEVEEKCR